MLPYWRALIHFLLSRGINSASSFFKKNNFPHFTREEILGHLQLLYGKLNNKELDLIRLKPLHMRNNWGRIVQGISNKCLHGFGFPLIHRSLGDFYSTAVSRIIKNREVRIFIEVLSLSGCTPETIAELVITRFKMKPVLTSDEIQEYCFWFFDTQWLDDIDWQNYLKRFHQCDLRDDNIFLAECEDKLYALRHKQSEVFCRLGLKTSLGYDEMLENIRDSFYDSIIDDLENHGDLDRAAKKVNTFLRLGGENQRVMSAGSGTTMLVDGEVMCVNVDDLDMIPVMTDDNLLQWKVADEK